MWPEKEDKKEKVEAKRCITELEYLRLKLDLFEKTDLTKDEIKEV
ncbi:unnamed protein product, partial [marine sediment metagenome]